MVGMLVLRRLVAGGCEHAVVVRRTRSGAALLTMSAIEGAAVLRSWFFLAGVGLHSGQRLRHLTCGIHGGTAQAHSDCRGDVGHEHRKCAQHSCQQELRKLRGYQPSVRVFVPCHGRDYTPVSAPVGSGGRCPTVFGRRTLNSFGKIFRRPTNSI